MSKTFQWIKGEDAGKVIQWDGESTDYVDGVGNFLIFVDGTRANESLLDDYFMEVASGNAEDLILLPDEKEAPQVAPKQTIITTSRTENPAPTVSAIHTLLAESKKVKSTVEVSLVADMPPAELMRILAESYEDGEKQVLDYIATTLDIEDIRKQIAKRVWIEAFTHNKKKQRNVKREQEENFI